MFLQGFDLINDIYIIFIIITSKIRCSSKHLLTACHVVDLIHDEVLGSPMCFFHVFDLIHDEIHGFSRCFCRVLILSMIYKYI